MILHWVLIPIKIIGIFIVANLHKLVAKIKYPLPDVVDKKPNLTKLKLQYEKCYDWVTQEFRTGVATYSYYNCGGNADHQVLRHGSLAWCRPAASIVNGFINYFDKEVEIQRGIKSVTNGEVEFCEKTPAPPAMPMSVAHGIMSARVKNVALDINLLVKFLYFVDLEIARDFTRGDVSTKPRALSTGFDAIYALSLLYTAYYLTGNARYTKEANKILWLRGYAFLLLAPITYVKNRNSFIDHIALFGLRTAWLACPSKVVKALLGHSMQFVGSQSYHQTNPYFAALMHECGVLPEEQRKQVLHIHRNADAISISQYRKLEYNGINPSDYSSQTADEFVLDNLQGGGFDVGNPVERLVGLNGICLIKSLELLLGES